MCYMFWHLERKCLQCWSNLVITKQWVAEIVRQRVSGQQRMPDERTCCDDVVKR